MNGRVRALVLAQRQQPTSHCKKTLDEDGCSEPKARKAARRGPSTGWPYAVRVSTQSNKR